MNVKLLLRATQKHTTTKHNRCSWDRIPFNREHYFREIIVRVMIYRGHIVSRMSRQNTYNVVQLKLRPGPTSNAK